MFKRANPEREYFDAEEEQVKAANLVLEDDLMMENFFDIMLYEQNQEINKGSSTVH
ncbi:6263_t:CDS:2 [Dentiscutata erythropus]|uniref:6263_t:CDS:1 n=1 Tax=Dentiscutata erythropus TaxID=1348616 RepID=A0A9N9G9K8_9GLOM|nr:6263_t:CDS:2 [Dentiscutata erythropus]